MHFQMLIKQDYNNAIIKAVLKSHTDCEVSQDKLTLAYQFCPRDKLYHTTDRVSMSGTGRGDP